MQVVNLMISGIHLAVNRAQRFILPDSRHVCWKDSMESKRCAASCRWAVPTLFQPDPMWLESWNRPWTCVREALPHALETTDTCVMCRRWETREEPVTRGRDD